MFSTALKPLIYETDEKEISFLGKVIYVCRFPTHLALPLLSPQLVVSPLRACVGAQNTGTETGATNKKIPKNMWAGGGRPVQQQKTKATAGKIRIRIGS